MNSGEAVEVTSGRDLSVTKGIDQIKGIERIGVEGKVLGVLRSSCKIWNVYDSFSNFVDLLTWAAANDHSKPIPIPMIGGIVELMMQDVDRLQAEVDQAVYRNIQRLLNDTKRKGLITVKGLIYSRSFRDKASSVNLEYTLYPISQDQFSQMLKGKILYYDSLNYIIDGEYVLLIRKQTDTERDMRINIVETIFKK